MNLNSSIEMTLKKTSDGYIIIGLSTILLK